jgi:glycosyltransferase involved in cell wall biosynthesis
MANEQAHNQAPHARVSGLLRALRTAGLIFSPVHAVGNLRNLWLWSRVVRTTESLHIWAKYFDSNFYLQSYPDVAEKGLDPCLHFLTRGNMEGRRPSPLFSTGDYLTAYPDVRRSGVNALLHYALFGHSERRTALAEQMPEVSPAIPTAEAASPPPGPHFLQIERTQVAINNYWPDDRPLVSVIIPCFNYGAYIEDAIRSVVTQTFAAAEIIVVDGGSTDAHTIERLRRVEAERLPGVSVFYREGRHLAGDNRNYGIARAHGRYICCLDADDMLSPTYCEVAVFLAEGYGHDLVYSSIQCFGNSDFRWLVTDARFPAIANRNQIATTALFRKADWAHTGGFCDWPAGDDHIPEDWEFWVRLMAYGCRAKSIREPLMLYRVHHGSLSSVSDKDPDRQSRGIQAHDALLLSDCQPAGDVEIKLFSRWSNLDSGDGDPRPGFLLALPFATIGGAETLLYGLAQEVARRGFRLIVVTSLILPEVVPDNIKSFTVLTPHVYPLAHLFHDPGVPEEFVCRLVKRYRVSHLFFAGCELVYHLLPRLREESPFLTVIDQLFNDEVHAPNNRRYRAYIDATVVPSESLKASLLRRTPDAPGRIHVVPHSVDIPAPESRAMRQLRESLSLPPEKVIVAFFGRLSPEKGADVFVEIVRALAPRSDLFFLMTGEGPERSRISALIRQYGLKSTIHAPGFVEDVRPLMAASDIVVVPSILDGMPLVVLESQAHGKAVVASSVGSIPSMISDAATGFLCPPSEVPAFVRRIQQLADDPSLRVALGRAARAGVRERFSKDTMLRSYFDVFEESQPKNQKESHVSAVG